MCSKGGTGKGKVNIIGQRWENARYCGNLRSKKGILNLHGGGVRIGNEIINKCNRDQVLVWTIMLVGRDESL